MNNKEYRRKYKENRPVVAICYDFDKTLSPDDMQAQGYIQAVKYSGALVKTKNQTFYNEPNNSGYSLCII